MKKKVAIVLNSLWNIYNFRLPLIADIQKSGYDVLVVAPRDTDTDKLDELGYEYVELKSLSRKGTNPIKELKLIKELKNIYKDNKVDLALHFTIKPNIYGCIAASQIKIPSIAVVTGLGFTFLSSGLSSKAAKKLYKYAFKKNTMTIFQNGDDRKLFLNLGLVSSERSQVILGSGIDIDRFTNENTEYSLKKNALFVGRLLFDKGIRELLEGFKATSNELGDVQLNIVGDLDKNNPSSLSQDDLDGYKNDERIVFHGFSKDVRAFVSKADVVILPSYREGLPRTMLEAISMGKPIITTDVAGCREVISKTGKNGYIVQSQSADGITKAITDFYTKSESERKEMGSLGRKMAEEMFSCSVINKEYLTLIKSITK